MNKNVHNPVGNRAEKRRRDFGIIGRAQQSSAAEFVSRVPLPSGKRLLDVNCGTGIASIPAARAGADVTGVDTREPFLSRGRAWAKNEDLLIRFKRADAERLPFSDGNFHTVINFMGLPFTEEPVTAASEMQRVCHRGGQLAVAFWDPSGLVGDMLRVTFQYTGAPRLARALELCEPKALQGLFSKARTRDPAKTHRSDLYFPLPLSETIACYLEFFAPINDAASELESEARDALASELEDLWAAAGETTGNSTRATAYFHEMTLIK